MLVLATSIATLTAVTWSYLALARGSFWRRKSANPDASDKAGFSDGVLAVVPARNEAELIGPVVTSLLNQNVAMPVLLVDDESTDGTADVARRAAEKAGKAHALFMLYPPAWIRNTRRSTAGAVGGCMLVRAETLERAGGLEAIRGAVIDDCALAGLLKQHGGRLWIGLTDQSQSLRRYETFSQIAHSSIAADRSPKPPPSQVDVGSRNDHQKKPEQRTVARTMNHGKSLKWWAQQDSNLRPTDYESFRSGRK